MRQKLADSLLHGYQAISTFVAHWTRLEYDGPANLPRGPALLVANHGFGTIYDMNAFVLAWLLAHHGPPETSAVTILSHEAAWALGLGQWVAPLGFVRASRENALAALAQGHLVLVLPGGDLDAAKDFRHRNEVVFGGRSGFADIAMRADVPIIPIAISGAGDTALVLRDGQRLARWLRLPQNLRLKTCPISLTLPWGLTFGLAGMAMPYWPLPAKMCATVLAPMRATADETPAAFAARVQAAMNQAMQAMTHDRIPVLGLHWPKRSRR